MNGKAALRTGSGIHCGQAIVGTMMPPTAPNSSAIGDCVNAAARLRVESRDLGCVIVVTDEVIRQASTDFGRFPRRRVALHGKQQSVQVYLVGNPAEIPPEISKDAG